MPALRFIKALIVGTCLTVLITAADDAASAGRENAVRENTPTLQLASMSAESARPTAADQEIVKTPVTDEDGRAYQNLSTFGALVLGVLGLWWVRRHTAEL